MLPVAPFSVPSAGNKETSLYTPVAGTPVKFRFRIETTVKRRCMCFSASASFGAGVVLSAIGVVAIKKAKTRAQLPFATIPLLFAVQQISEGFLWLALAEPGYEGLQQFTTYTFLFFAQVVWPFWVPFSILKFETNPKRKQIGRVVTGIGAMVSAYLAFCLLFYPVEASIEGYHISYDQDYPGGVGRASAIFYMIATIGPPFFSSARYMWALGTAILISYIVTTIFYTDYIVSVWCFFASVISIAVLGVIYTSRKS
jgi:hypothetical protein